MTSQRPLNALEDLFASCNVRFAILLVLENETKDAAFQNALAACERCRLGHLALSHDGSDRWMLLTDIESVAMAPGLQDVPVHLDDFGKYLDDSIYRATLPVEGPLSLRLLPYRVTDAGAGGVMLYVNANHAICDGRSLMHFLGCASNALPAQQFSKKWQELGALPDWKEMVAEGKLERWDDDPPYLCSKNQILNIKELCLEHTSKGDDCLRFDLSNTNLQSLRQRLNVEAEGATLTGFLIALFMRCLAAEYTGSKARDLAVSVLVDLRGYLSPDESGDQLPQAHGTVTVIDAIEAISADDATIETIWQKAIEMTNQLRERVARGEAHRSALAMTEGRFDAAPPEATIELSNLGVCQTPEGAKLYTAQRFDGYEGVSCMIHSEGNKAGSMRWSVSLGQGLDSKLLRRVFEAAKEQLGGMAVTASLAP